MVSDLYAIRYKDGRLSTTGTAEDIFAGLQRILPVDKIFRVIEHPDGKGYEYRQVGTIVVDFAPNDNMPIAVPLPDPSPPPQNLTTGQPEALESIPVEMPTESYTFEADTEPPKSQAQIAKELGLPEAEQPLLPLKARKRQTKAEKKTKQVSDISDQCSDDPEDRSWLKGVPQPVRVSSPGRAQVNSVRQATAEEAAAASHFGKGF